MVRDRGNLITTWMDRWWMGHIGLSRNKRPYFLKREKSLIDKMNGIVNESSRKAFFKEKK
jgi:hypothetical protein